MANADSIAKLKAYQKAYREANKEKYREYHKRYRLENKESRQEKAAIYYQNNKEEFKRRAAEWGAANPEKRRVIRANWAKSHPDQTIEIKRRTRAGRREQDNAQGRAYRLANPEIVKNAQKKWNDANPGANAHHVGLRRTRKLQATPAWADLEAIKAVYSRSAELTKATGIQHHVDHCYPLRGRLVCGLHNEFNLQVITAAENQAKHNRFVP